MFFFFSSRRRHTRWTGDWSSDVCSSDLQGRAVPGQQPAADQQRAGALEGLRPVVGAEDVRLVGEQHQVDLVPVDVRQIGRASCRERGEISVVAGALKKKRRDKDEYELRN